MKYHSEMCSLTISPGISKKVCISSLDIAEAHMYDSKQQFLLFK